MMINTTGTIASIGGFALPILPAVPAPRQGSGVPVAGSAAWRLRILAVTPPDSARRALMV